MCLLAAWPHENWLLLLLCYFFFSLFFSVPAPALVLVVPNGVLVRALWRMHAPACGCALCMHTQGVLARRAFKSWRVDSALTRGQARSIFESAGVPQYWDMALRLTEKASVVGNTAMAQIIPAGLATK